MKSKLFIGTLLLLMVFVSCKKEKPQPNTPKSGEEQENPLGGDTIPTGNTNIGFLVCAGGEIGSFANKPIYFNDLDSIVLRKLEQNTQTFEYTELSKITVLPSDFTSNYNLLNFTSFNINQSVLSQLGSAGGYKVEMSIYLSVPLNHITVVQNGWTGRRLSVHNISTTDSPCAQGYGGQMSRVSVGDDSNRCKLVGIN